MLILADAVVTYMKDTTDTNSSDVTEQSPDDRAFTIAHPTATFASPALPPQHLLSSALPSATVCRMSCTPLRLEPTMHRHPAVLIDIQRLLYALLRPLRILEVPS